MIKISVITSLYNCSKYLQGYFDAVEKITNKEECEFLLLHNAPTDEELSIIKWEIEEKFWFRHIIIEEREGLYATWNRGVQLSEGRYCAVWNVDDIRFPNSLQLQASALDANVEYGLITGDINGTDVYGEVGTKIYKHNRFEYKPKEALKSSLIGCFPMWRKCIHNKIGYFDEQFKCVADFDFQIRVAMEYKIYSVSTSLGVYLENDPNKISSNGLQLLENNIVYLRYGVFEKIVIPKLLKSLKLYKHNHLINNKIIIELQIQKPFNIFYRISGLLYSFLLIPYHVIREIKHKII